MDSLVTMSGIARIGNVTRQAVTNWRARPSNVAFPSPQTVINGVEHFNRGEVVEWLEATGRGLNKDARLDAATVAVPENLAVDDAVTMLALRSRVGHDLGPLSADERARLACEADPHNSFLLDEVTRLAEHSELATFVDALHEASFGPSDALDRLFLSRAAHGSRGLSSDAVRILQKLAETCRIFLGPDEVAIDFRLDPRARAIARGFDSASPHSSREALQLHAIDGLQVTSNAGPLVKVISLTGLDDVEALETAGDIAIDLDSDQIAIVIGPATALCDRLTGDLYDSRKSSLEMGARDYGCTLVAAFKLPRGLWRHAHRQSLGIWVLRGNARASAAVVADLSGASVDAGELAADLLGALEQTGARAYRYGRALPYNTVWTTDTVVPPGIRAQPATTFDAPSAYDRLIRSTLVTREAVPGFDVRVARPASPGPVAPRTLGDLIDAGAIHRERGTRIAEDDLDPLGSVPVISSGGGEPRWIDRLVEAQRYRSANRTEPGDVVFSTNPPRAIVDEAGGAIVVFPSRILRPNPHRAEIGPRALAATINRLKDNTEWKTWPIPRFPATQVQRVEETILEADQHLAELRKHEAATADLVTAVIQGVAAGSVIVESLNTEMKAG